MRSHSLAPIASKKFGLEKDKPPILGLIQRGGPVVLRMLANVQQITIQPIIEAAVATDTLVHTDEYGVYARLEAWGYRHKTVCHGLPWARRIRPRRGRGWVLRGARQHHRGVLVAAALLAAPAPGHLAGQAAGLPRLLPGRAQRTPSRQSPARRTRCRLGRMTQTNTPQANKSHPPLNERQEKLIDEALEETFPASDPIAPKRITK